MFVRRPKWRVVPCAWLFVLVITTDGQSQRATKPQFLIRGYLAVSTRTADPDEKAGQHNDVFLPGIKVFAENQLTGERSMPTVTDLSGRFTTAPLRPGRYKICWSAPGFVNDCSRESFSVRNSHLHVSTIRLRVKRQENSTFVFGRVAMSDGSTPRSFAPMQGLNSMARVELHTGGGAHAVATALVNNFGRYVLPVVPVRQPVELRAMIEGAQSRQRILNEAGLHLSSQHQIDLVIPNNRPQLDPVVATVGGKRVRVGEPGGKVVLQGRADDPDGDPLEFRWMLEGSGGSLSATDAQNVSWTLPTVAGTYGVSLLVYDKKGGYAKSNLTLQVHDRGVAFEGKVVGTDAPFVADAIVDVNGEIVATGADGRFHVRVKESDRYIVNIRKPGYMLNSTLYDDGVTGGEWTLVKASVFHVDPTQEISVQDVRDERNCLGPRTLRLNFREFPHASIPQWQDGKGRVIAAPRDPKGPLFLPLQNKNLFGRKCGPGISLKIPANSLVDADGNPPAGKVDVTLGTVDLRTPGQMPGDYTVRRPDGSATTMQSFGAGTIEVTAGGKEFNLRNGATARVEIPIDVAQLTTGTPPPPDLPLLFYNERTGDWEQEGRMTLQGNSYVAEVKHFSAINADTLKENQACVRVLSPTLPASFRLEVYIPQEDDLGNPLAPRIIDRIVDNSSPSEHVIYNLPTETNIVLVPIRQDTNIPMGTFVVNTGQPQNPTNPNRPSGPPYVACSTEVTLTEQALPPAPLFGEFLAGLSSFQATNITELLAADPTSPLAAELTTATQNYYDQIDPRGRRTTLADFQTFNGFGGASEIRVVFANSGDLGFGRDMHGVDNGLDKAAYVTNYGDINTPDSQDAQDAVDQLSPIATVAMEYSRIESPPGSPVEFDDPERVVKFYVYGADGNLITAADLDGFGLRPIPQLCMVCHGGAYSVAPTPSGAPSFPDRASVKLGSKFLPFDLHLYTFAPAPFDKASQQNAFRQFNQTIIAGSPPDAVIQQLITDWYSGGSNQNENTVVAGWNSQPLHQQMYRDVVSRACRTCHVGNVFSPLQFDQAGQIINLLGTTENRVCVQHVMPHAKVTHGVFWNSVAPHQPAIFQVFGDAFGGPAGWNGTLCGDFTPGGSTPVTFYTGTIQPIFDSRCTACHVGASPPAGLNLSAANSYANLVNVFSTEVPGLRRVQPGNANNSYLIHKIEGTQAVGSQMPPLPPALSASQINDIRSWIDSGADP